LCLRAVLEFSNLFPIVPTSF